MPSVALISDQIHFDTTQDSKETTESVISNMQQGERHVYEDVTQKSKYLENGTLFLPPIKKHSVQINGYNMSKNMFFQRR